MKIVGSDGYLIADDKTGLVIGRNHEDVPEYNNIERFDYNSIKLPYLVYDEVDILYIGHWYKDGTYEAPIEYVNQTKNTRSITMTPTLAQLFYLELTHGCENLGRDYKSEFANQGTPKRRSKPKSGFKPFKLFKGHRL